MSGWSKKKRQAFETAFYGFLDNVTINSKDSGHGTVLGSNLFDGQKRFVNCVLDALEEDKHSVFCLKSRQLGISTISRALSIFYLGAVPGLNGALVMDTDSNKKNARREIEQMIDNLPTKLKFPRIIQRNRDGLTLSNQSTILFMSAGVRASKSSGTLGRSVGLSFAHLSELCSYDNDEGIEAFEQSLSDVNPDRLYIRESTARGFNRWHEQWVEARADKDHCACVFLGWWSKPSQSIGRTDPDFKRYGLPPPTEREMKMIEEVRTLYDHQITPSQLAWYRRKMDPSAETEGDTEVEYVGSVTRVQEQPSTESESFQFTGVAFFTPEKLTEQHNVHVSKKYQTFMFSSGIEFTDCRVYPAPNTRMIELKVWEEPDPQGVYVVAADPAFGSNEKNDRSCIQVMRCYADGMDQVAEYAWPLIGTRPFAWVILALAGWYAGETGEVYLIVELNGPGGAVWDEIVHVRHHINSGYQPKEIADRGLRAIFQNVRNYIYTRSDAMGGGRNWMWKTSGGSGPTGKVRLMERLRDFCDNGMLHIRSAETLDEMRTVTREGDVIGAQGHKKDDRVTGLALGVRCWEERIRRTLATQKRTRENEAAKRRMSIVDQSGLFMANQLQSFFAVKRVKRARDNRILRRAGWRYR